MPLPVIPDVRVIQGSLAVALYAQFCAPVGKSTPIDPVAAAASAMAGGAGVNIAVQPGVGAAPCCKTTKGVNDASMAPTRGVVDIFAVVLYSMLPLPVPLCPEVMLSQVAVLMASHGQSLAWNMMENLPLVESDPATMGLVGANVASQAMPACVSMKVRGAPPALDPEPATVMAPIRGCELIFAA